MLTFKRFLTEGDTTRAYDMEKVIVSAAGGPSFSSKLIPDSETIGKKIVNDMKLDGVGKFPKNTYPASDRWNKYFAPKKASGSTLTPKTDFMIGDKKISLKTGDAQLMGGGVNEASATFFTAVEESGMSTDKVVLELGNHIKNLLPSSNLKKLGIKGNKTELEQAGKFIEIEMLKKADDAHHAFKNDLRKVFSDNQKFAEAFTHEAMTGKVKFGNNDGTAEYFLIVNYEGSAQLHNAFTDKSYVRKISSQVKPDVKFKSTQSTAAALKTASNPKGKTGYYTFWSAVGLGVKMIVEEEIKNSQNMLNEGIVDSLKDFTERIMNKAKKWLSNVMQKIKKIIGDSWKALLVFMGIEPQISFNNNISW